MLVRKIVALAGTTLIGMGIEYFRRKRSYSNAQQQANSLGSFVIWGRPDSGKTTFITRLLGNEPGEKKEATDSKTIHKNIELNYLKSGLSIIKEIVDMPGNTDRRYDWLEMVVEKDHAFYLINLVRMSEPEYLTQVRKDIDLTVDELERSGREHKRINFIATHLDQSQWKDLDPANVNNVLNEDKSIRQFRESRRGVKGCLYSVNLLEKSAFQKLMQDIVNDISN
jgi:hypothetical protein